MAGYYNPNFGQDYLAARGIGPSYLNTNEKKGVAPSEASGPVKPITSWSDLGDQISKPFTDQFSGVSKTAGNLSNAASQLGQGNVMGAVNAARGAAPAVPAAADAATDAIPGAVDFTKSVTPLSSDGIVSSIGDALSGGMDALAALFA